MTFFLKAATLLFSTLLSVFAPVPQTKDVKAMEGKPLPAFEMKSVNGSDINNKSLEGKPAVIDFWASWCTPCMKVSPVMQELHEQYAKKGLLVIGANGLEDELGPSKAQVYLKEHKYTYRFTHSNDTLMTDWGIHGVPTIIMVNKKGIVTKVQVGYSENSKQQMKKAVSLLVE